MVYLEQKFHRKERKLRRNYAIEDSLYIRLKQSSLIYEASLSDLLNICLEDLIKREAVVLYDRTSGSYFGMHMFHVWESNVIGLDCLKEKYGVNIQQLVNMAIKNALDDDEETKSR